MSDTIIYDSNLYFGFEQVAESDIWIINHNLDKYPSVITLNLLGNVIAGSVTYDTKDKIIIRFTKPQSGRVYLNK